MNDAGMRAWIADPQRYKPGVFMPQVPSPPPTSPPLSHI